MQRHELINSSEPICLIYGTPFAKSSPVLRWNTWDMHQQALQCNRSSSNNTQRSHELNTHTHTHAIRLSLIAPQ